MNRLLQEGLLEPKYYDHGLVYKFIRFVFITDVSEQ